MNILISIIASGGRDGYYTMNAICGTPVVVGGGGGGDGGGGSGVNLLTVSGLCVSIGSSA